MKELLYDIVEAIIDNKDDIKINEKAGTGNNIIFELSVAQGDMGKVIGKKGKIARAIRNVMRAAGSIQNKRVSVEII